jgi:hypothetical protein
MKSIARLLAMILGCTPAWSIACEARLVSCSSHIRDAQFVAVGYVLDVRHTSPEQVEPGPFRTPLMTWPERQVLAVPSLVLAGSMPEPMYLNVPCRAPFPNLYERAVFGVTSEGWHWVFPADMEEEHLLEIVGGG